MEYSLIANCADGRQLTGSGYKTFADVQKAIIERARYHTNGSTKLIGMVLVQSNGVVMFVQPSGFILPRIATEATV